jgi:hypothetical protein
MKPSMIGYVESRFEIYRKTVYSAAKQYSKIDDNAHRLAQAVGSIIAVYSRTAGAPDARRLGGWIAIPRGCYS